MATTPFRVRLDARPSELAAGEKQKLEILKQLYLRAAPADPGRADLGADAAGGRRGARPRCASSRAAASCTVLIITHKFREVTAFADDVTVLRRGKAVHDCAVAATEPDALAAGHGGR